MSEEKVPISNRLNLNEGFSALFYERLPGPIRDLLHPFVRSAYLALHRIYSIASDIRKPVRLIGNERNPDFNLLLAGSGDTSFLINRVFPADSRTRTRSRQFLWKMASMDRSQADVVLFEADRCFSELLYRRGFFIIPEWVLFTLDTSKSLDEISKSYAKLEAGNFHKISKFQYEWEVACDRDRLRLFYDRMYIPYILSRFGKSALLVSFAFLESLLHKGKLLLVKRRGEYVSGCFIFTAEPRPQVWFQGIMDGRKEYLKEGAVTALYYYTIVWAKENDYSEVDFGHCRPFLNDGVFLYKKRWGMKVEINPKKHRVLYLSIRTLTPQIKEFLFNNPFLYEDKKQLKGLVFVRGNGLISKSERDAIERRYSVLGLSGISLVLKDGPNGETINPKELSQNDANISQTP